MKKILIALSQYGGYPGDPTPEFAKRGFEAVFNPHGRKLTADEVVDLAKDCDGILAGLEPLNKSVLEKLPKVRVLSRAGIGVDNIDLAYAKSKNIQVLITPEAIQQSVVELTIGAILSLLRRVAEADRLIRAGKWTRLKGVQLSGKRFGVAGLGRIGKGVARAASALGAQVMAADLKPDLDWAEKENVSIVPMDQLLAEADVVSLHVPSLPEGKALIGASELGKMKEGAFLVNFSRGGVVDEEALLAALTKGRLGGAALDVFSQEPYTGPLARLDNVVLTAHMGSHTVEARQQMERDAARNLMDALEEKA